MNELPADQDPNRRTLLAHAADEMELERVFRQNPMSEVIIEVDGQRTWRGPFLASLKVKRPPE